MSIADYMMFPDDFQQMIQALAKWPCKVYDVKDMSGSGFVRVTCYGLYGDGISNWMPVAGGNNGSDGSSRSHTGLHNPPQPGGSGYIWFAGGNFRKPTFSAGAPWMDSPGDPGNSRT